MLVCFVLYIVLLFLFVKKREKIYLLFLLVNTAALLVFVMDINEAEKYKKGVIERNESGEGEKKEELTVRVEGHSGKEKITVDVGERRLTEEEIQSAFEEVMSGLDGQILGDNESFDHVDKNLNFPKTYGDFPITITWETNRHDLIDSEGKLKQDDIEEEGSLVEIRGVLRYEEKEAIYIKSVRVFPRRLNGKDKLISDIHKEVEKKEEATKTGKELILPTEIGEGKLFWEKQPGKRGYTVLLLGGAVVFLLPLLEKEKRKEKEKKRKEQLLWDYPEMLGQLVLLLGTGMTLRNVWQRIVERYRKEKPVKGERAVYEEMGCALGEMRSGVTEAEGYERFGKRCMLPEYKRLGTILSQNLKKGTGGLTEVLEAEEKNAFEERKNRAKKLGEEASTKLLFPMSMMLVVVLVIVIVPAFLSIQL